MTGQGAALPAAASGATASTSCAVCGMPAREVVRTAEEIAAELDARDRFFAERLNRDIPADGVRDVTDVALGTAATVLRCTRCGILVRDAVPGEVVFREDEYDERVLRALHETHVRAFEAKEADYRPLLPSAAHVAEVGSYVGGFLAVAKKWGWTAIGADIGLDTARFCRDLGFDVRTLHLDECGLEAGSLDGVFVWNCFEQIATPARLLAEARRVVRDEGLVVIRVPDANFYLNETRLAALAYNNLLGWPHRFGYDEQALRTFVESHGFAFVRLLRRPAMRPMREAMQPWARDEEAQLRRDADYGWIEVTFERK